MNRMLWIALPTLALAGCNRAAPPPVENAALDNSAETNAAASAPVPVTDAATYLTKAGAGDLFEIESSRAIADKTGNAGIKAFAQMMITDHGKSTARLKAAAREAGLTAPTPSLDPAQQQTLDAIRNATGTAADSAYLDAQRTGHSEALALHSGYAVGGDTEPLKKAANEIAPVVQHHIDQLARLTVTAQ